MTTGIALEVDRQNLTSFRRVDLELPSALKDGEVLLAVDHFALTSNNVTYCQVGDALGYWRFFPTGDDRWGRVPAMGYADVVASAHPEIDVGERVWGFFPMASHLLIEAGRVTDHGFSDVSAHREGLAPVYAQFQRARTNPIYEAGREAQDCLLRGLFLTAWLCEDALAERDDFPAGDCLITSASSKTSIALAFALGERGRHGRVAVTSARNAPFCTSLGCYDEVVTYDSIAALATDRPAVLIDMAGNASVNAAIHAPVGAQLVADYRIGITHHDAAPASREALSGPAPEMFFAPHQAQQRSKEWGPAELEARIASAFARFRIFADDWLKVEHVAGAEAAEKAFRALLEGAVPAEVGYSVSLSSSD